MMLKYVQIGELGRNERNVISMVSGSGLDGEKHGINIIRDLLLDLHMP